MKNALSLRLLAMTLVLALVIGLSPMIAVADTANDLGEAGASVTGVVGGEETIAVEAGEKETAQQPGALMAGAQEFQQEYTYPYQDPNLPVNERVDNLMELMTLDEKISYFSPTGAAIPRLGLQTYTTGQEALHGVAWGGEATMFTGSIGLSQTWNDDLMEEIGYAVGLEQHAKTYLQNGTGAMVRSPVVDLLRDPRAGRSYETYGEDAFLTGSLATAWSKGMNARTEDGYQLLIPTLKHFFAYNNEVLRLWTNSSLTPRTMNEYFYKSFQYPIQAGAAKAIMTSYNLINGVPAMLFPGITTELKNKWVPEYPESGTWEFTNETDAGNPQNLYRANQGYYPDTAEGRAMSIADGIKNGTINMVGTSNWQAHVYDAIARGFLTEEDINDSTRRVMTMRARLGDLDHFDIISPYNDPEFVQDLRTNESDNKELALRSAQESLVLLKNDSNTLPLNGANAAQTGVVLLGMMADVVMLDYYSGTFNYKVSVEDALKNKLGAGKVSFSRAVDTVAIKASNGQYLQVPGAAAGGNLTADAGTVIPTMADTRSLFQMYDYGSDFWLLRSPVNDRFVYNVNNNGSTNPITTSSSGTNSTQGSGAPGALATGRLQWYALQRWMLPEVAPGVRAMYNAFVNHGEANEMNFGRFFGLNASNNVVQQGTDGAYDTQERIDALTAEQKFNFDIVESKRTAISNAIAASNPNAPVIIVLGQDTQGVAAESLDLYKTGLSAGQKEVVDYVTTELNKDVVLVVKASNPMAIQKEVQNNPRVKSILFTCGNPGQEEGNAIVSALFDNGHNGGGSSTDWNTPYNGFIAPFSPAGRLSATWYEKIEDMPGATTDHRPVSYIDPLYDPETNNNMDNLTGSIPTGILTYDIIKGERTYQYSKKTPVYAFGYGLTYTDFAYSNMSVSPVSEDGEFTISVDVKNVGTTYTSDEVVQFYGGYDTSQSRAPRFEQANKRLIAYSRVKSIAPGETRNVTVTVDLKDKLGVWDMTRDMFWVEPGDYIIEAARSSADNNSAKMTLTVTGSELPARDLTELTMAKNFNDYKTLDKVELTDCSYDGSTAVRFNAKDEWIVFKDAYFNAAATKLTALVSADRDTVFSVYSGKPGTGSLLGTFNFADSRPDTSLPNDGEVRKFDYAGGGGAAPNTGVSQDYWDIHLTNPQFRNKPEWKKVAVDITVPAGTHDIYIASSQRGASVAWFKFANDTDVTDNIAAITTPSINLHIRERGMSLRLFAELEPITSMSGVTWSVDSTDLATIDINTGVLKANGTGNGTVNVTATSGTESLTVPVQITNQLEENKYNGNTVDYISMKITTGNDDCIFVKGGTRQQSLYYRAPNLDRVRTTMYNQGGATTLPNDMADWTVTDLNGDPTDLATVSETGLLTATGNGNGKVKLTATFKNNPDIFTERVFTLTNQDTRNAYVALHSAGSTLNGATPATGNATGDERGLRVTTAANNIFRYTDIDFGKGEGADGVYIRLGTTVTNLTVSVWIDGATAADGGTKITEIACPGTGNTSGFTAKHATYSAKLIDGVTVTGIHDVYLVFSGASMFKWIQFTGGMVNPTEATGVSLDKETLELTVGDTAKLTATVEPEDATNKSVAWISSDEDVATVDSDGNVTAVAPGTATITVTTGDGGFTAECEVTVNAAFVDVTSVKIDGAAIQQLRIRNTKQFTATVNPTNATEQSVTWESSNPKIFTVDEEGLVKGVGTGSAKLIITASNGKTSFIMIQITA